MKKLFLICLLCFSFVNLKAQLHFPTYKDKPVWSVIDLNDNGMPFKFTVQYHSYSDTLIKGISYSVIRSYPKTQYNYGRITIYRVAAEKVFVVDTTSLKEYLIYDFSKKAGDSMYYYQFDWKQVDSLMIQFHKTDSFQNKSGKWLYRMYGKKSLYTLYKDSSDVVWIKGLGDTSDPFVNVFPRTIDGDSRVGLLCIDTNGTNM